ncbi:helix-turn-helix transcriptional regulator [Paenibacillus kribbensis]|uniref:helix-turn-helix transcriptional regulator n=1 Tax=Paenibacillus kribbensis TaxID=172713 RepID=UPI0008392581|nr:YafY family protein [Paenibacillus kribbensis]
MKIDRLLSIVMLLLERDRVSSSKLAEMFEVTPRTIFRDIETINKAGIPIITYPGASGGIGIMEKYKIQKKIFTVADITALLLGLNGLHASMSSEEILNTIAKVKSLVSEEQLRFVESKMAIDPSPWFGKATIRPNFEQLQTALLRNLLISFNYLDQFDQLTQHKVEPYRLVLKDASWYLQAYCTTRQGFRMFRLSCMSSLTLHNEHFSPKSFAFEPWDSTEKEQVILKLLIDESLRMYMEGYCGKENIKPYKDNKLVAFFPFIENDYGYGHLLSFGDKCECLEPEHVRQEIYNRLQRSISKYIHS